jgi:hypothetical protein
MRKTFTLLAALGAFALAPSIASAFTGNLVTCSPTAGTPTVVKLKPGLSCATEKNKIQIKKSLMDGCSATTAAGTSTAFCKKAGKPSPCCTGEGTGVGCNVWDVWQGNKLNSKITAADAALIDSVSIDLKAQSFGSCNFSGSPDSFSASGAGKFTFFDAAGDKVKKGKAKFYGTVGGDLTTQSASTTGLITKGFAAGAKVKILIGIDLAGASDCDLTKKCKAAGDPWGCCTDKKTGSCGGVGSCNGNILACNLGLACPPTFQPSFFLDLITTPSSVFRIDIEDNADCVGNNDPFPCCTGAGAGNC